MRITVELTKEQATSLLRFLRVEAFKGDKPYVDASEKLRIALGRKLKA